MDQVANHIWRVVNGVFPSNTYICATGEPEACFLVDPGTDTEAIDAALGALALKPCRIYCTHGHFDHAGSAAFFQKKYGAPCYLHKADLNTLRGSNFLLMAFKVPFSMALPQVDEAEGLITMHGDQELRVICTPGHTPGSCIIQYGQAFFSGDTLYSYGVGLSRLPGEDSKRLKTTLLALWDQLPGEGVILPGHGDSATFATIRTGNAPLRKFLGLPEVASGETRG